MDLFADELDSDVNSNSLTVAGSAHARKQTATVSYFKALGHDTRLRCMQLLMTHGEMSVGELVNVLQESQPKVSRHLCYLRQLGLTIAFRREQWVYYSLHPKLPVWLRNTIKCCDWGCGS